MLIRGGPLLNTEMFIVRVPLFPLISMVQRGGGGLLQNSPCFDNCGEQIFPYISLMECLAKDLMENLSAGFRLWFGEEAPLFWVKRKPAS